MGKVKKSFLNYKYKLPLCFPQMFIDHGPIQNVYIC
jgi:hypothetical protein